MNNLNNKVFTNNMKNILYKLNKDGKVVTASVRESDKWHNSLYSKEELIQLINDGFMSEYNKNN
ncbi:hypothetical protein [Clostridium sp.]|uniref:hypothetical protein n=1 Tax=Clostridium sp. TaxID=1506 RepID=UPI0026195EE4|nr:hypothetical protein [Clostridium sp.]